MPTSETEQQSAILKLCLFATGLAGIVAEFVLSTLASYLLGDSIFQWSIIISLMLFSMGLGSYFTRFIRVHLLDIFIFTEFILSIFCAVSAGIAYWIAAYTQQVNLIIYGFAIIIGLLIGFEIPLVARINEAYEELRVNISAVMQYDYLGALVGGLLFSFFALPHLGLTYTPIVLGSINFLIALLLFLKFKNLTFYKRSISISTVFSGTILLLLFYTIQPLFLFSEQQQYKDKIVYQEQSPYQKIVITQWKHYFWLFINQNIQFSSYDEWLYHEPLVHPAMQMAAQPENILVLGGGDGLAVREVLKYKSVKRITLVDIDPAVTELGQNHPIFLALNRNSLNQKQVTIENLDAWRFLKQDTTLFDVIIVDLPDPNNVALSKLYSKNFYATVRRHLARNGTFVTQATDVSYASKTFCCILKTIESAGFSTLPYRNYIQTMGNWGWILGMHAEIFTENELKTKAEMLKFEGITTQFINQAAMKSMTHFGKGFLEYKQETEVNTELKPVLYQYYLQAYELLN